MSTRKDSAPAPTVRSRDDLIAWIAAGCKPPERWRIGTEHEKFLFLADTLDPVPYAGPRSVRALMESLIARFGWLPIMEGDNIIALRRPDGEAGGTVSLEPGGQFELSGDPLRTVHEVGAETHNHLSQCLDVGSPMGIGFLGVGFSPNWTQDETPRMPKQRYQVMRDLELDLQALRDEREPRPIADAARREGRARGRSALWIATASVVVAAAGFLWWRLAN